MRIRRLLRDSLLAAMAFVSLQAFQAYLLNEAVTRLDHAATHRLESSIAGVLNTAHHSKDDLAILQVMHCLSQSPGIIQARIEEAEHGNYGFVLRDGAQKWGHLVLDISNRSRRLLVRRQWFLGTGAAGLLWTILFVYLQLLEKRTTDLRIQVTELDGLLQSEKRKLVQSQEREQQKAHQSSACLQKAIRYISVPVLILDTHQRISAINEAALTRLKLSDSKDLIGRSWHELPALNGSGSVLEKSLEIPGQAIGWASPDSDVCFRFETDPNKLFGTWIFL